MKVVILAGGFGTRLSEETRDIPKPMVPIGDKPILWHIMKMYSHYGYNDFIILLGYKGYILKEYFSNYFLHNCDTTIDLITNNLKIHRNKSEPWQVTLVDTGLKTNTGGRLRRIRKYLKDEDAFMLTYGDGVSDVDIPELLKFHKSHGKLATLTAVQPEGRFGALTFDGNTITKFAEKKDNLNHWINGGFFVLSPKVLDYIDNDETALEKEPLEALSKKGQLMAYKHEGFWKAMDKLYDKVQLDKLWENDAPWRVWKNGP